MAKSAKPRKKKYQPRKTLFRSPLVNRPLNENEIGRMRRQLDEARMKIHLASTDRDATDTLATYLGYGYILAENFEQGDELKERFKKGLQALYRARWAIDLKQPVNGDDLTLIDEVTDYACEEISTLDLNTVLKLEAYFEKHAQKLFDLALSDIGGNQMRTMSPEEYELLLIAHQEGKIQLPGLPTSAPKPDPSLK